jgi:hypothetical protein
VIDFRYHLVSIVAVFLALAIGIVLGSTELQGSTISGLHSLSDSLKNQLSNVSAQRDAYQQQASASDAFLRRSPGRSRCSRSSTTCPAPPGPPCPRPTATSRRRTAPRSRLPPISRLPTSRRPRS